MTIDQIAKELKDISKELVRGKSDPRPLGAKIGYLVEKLEVAQANVFAELRSIAQAQWIGR